MGRCQQGKRMWGRHPNSGNDSNREPGEGQFKVRSSVGAAVAAVGLHLCGRLGEKLFSIIWYQHHDLGLSPGVDKLRDLQTPQFTFCLDSLRLLLFNRSSLRPGSVLGTKL